jgi:DNA polymerase III psi subunit
MIDPNRLAYLDAMGIEAWVARPPPPAPELLCLGPSAGSVLLICDETDMTGTPLATDIARYLGSSVTWGWPLTALQSAGSGEDHGDSRSTDPMTLEQAITEHLFTRVVFFGQTLHQQMLGSHSPAILGAAKIIISADLRALGIDARAKRDLWRQLSNRPVLQGKAA